jgi:membrane protein YqaA with SNARE-associated domain
MVSDVETRTPKDESESAKLSDLLQISWIRTALIVGIAITILGLVIVALLSAINFGETQLFTDSKAFVETYGLVGVFFVTLLAGTLLPLGSPAFVVAAALFGVPKAPLVLVATIGFTVGMMVNYGLAYLLGRPYVTRKVSAKRLNEIVNLWDRWGWVLYTIFGLIPVLPVELLSFICGLLKTRIIIFIALSFFPRLIVFAILAYFGEFAGNWIGLT